MSYRRRSTVIWVCCRLASLTWVPIRCSAASVSWTGLCTRAFATDSHPLAVHLPGSSRDDSPCCGPSALKEDGHLGCQQQSDELARQHPQGVGCRSLRRLARRHGTLAVSDWLPHLLLALELLDQRRQVRQAAPHVGQLASPLHYLPLPGMQLALQHKQGKTSLLTAFQRALPAKQMMQPAGQFCSLPA